MRYNVKYFSNMMMTLKEAHNYQASSECLSPAYSCFSRLSSLPANHTNMIIPKDLTHISSH